jgi:threonine synthase
MTATLARWRGLPYADLAFEILSLYIDDIPAADLKAICRKTYTEEVFGTPQIVPLKALDSRCAGMTGCVPGGAVQRPTLAFKDMAMQLLGNLFEYELAAAARSSTSWARPAATPAARPSTPCGARRACACS